LTTGGGARLYFQRSGSGPQTVLIPNGIYMVEDFARLANGRTLIFYDVRNRGRWDLVTIWMLFDSTLARTAWMSSGILISG
jgi:hypothetical protein